LEDTAALNVGVMGQAILAKVKNMLDKKTTYALRVGEVAHDLVWVYVLKTAIEATSGQAVTESMLGVVRSAAGMLSDASSFLTDAQAAHNVGTYANLTLAGLSMASTIIPLMSKLGGGYTKPIATIAAIPALGWMVGRGAEVATTYADQQWLGATWGFIKANFGYILGALSGLKGSLALIYRGYEKLKNTPFSWTMTAILCMFVYYAMILVLTTIASRMMEGDTRGQQEVIQVVSDGLEKYNAAFVANYDTLSQNIVAAAISGYMAINGSLPLSTRFLGGPVTLAEVDRQDSKIFAGNLVRAKAEDKIKNALLGNFTRAGIELAVRRLKEESADPTNETINRVIASMVARLGGVNADASRGGAYSGWVYLDRDSFVAATAFNLPDSVVGIAIDPNWGGPDKLARDMFVPVGSGEGLVNDPLKAGELARSVFGTKSDVSKLAKWQWDRDMKPVTIGDLFTGTGGAPFAHFVNDLMTRSVPEAEGPYDRWLIELVVDGLIAVGARRALRPNDRSLDTVSGSIQKPKAYRRDLTIGFDSTVHYNIMLLRSWNNLCDNSETAGDLEDYLNRIYGRDKSDSREYDILMEARKPGKLSTDDVKRILSTDPLEDTFLRSIRFTVFNLITPALRGRMNQNVRALYDKCVFLGKVGKCKLCQFIRKKPAAKAPLFWATGAVYDQERMKAAISPEETRFSGVIWPIPDAIPGDPDYGAVFESVKSDVTDLDGMTEMCLSCYTTYWSSRLAATAQKYGTTEAYKVMRSSVDFYQEHATRDQDGNLTQQELERWTDKIKTLSQESQHDFDVMMQQRAGMIRSD
tara:strand:- start:2808 stop:5240 length:2433 start_codon:yes stop_codon:yes gene_type:complete